MAAIQRKQNYFFIKMLSKKQLRDIKEKHNVRENKKAPY